MEKKAIFCDECNELIEKKTKNTKCNLCDGDFCENCIEYSSDVCADGYEQILMDIGIKEVCGKCSRLLQKELRNIIKSLIFKNKLDVEIKSILEKHLIAKKLLGEK